MFDEVPTEFWLLLLIGMFAFPMAKYAYRYVTNSPAKVDVVAPTPDMEWRKPWRFGFCVVALFALAFLAVFIFTPTAEAFAQSPEFFPLLLGTATCFAAYHTVNGLVKGEVSPLIRGKFGPFKRAERPIRYWISTAWNVLLTLAMAFLISKM